MTHSDSRRSNTCLFTKIHWRIPDEMDENRLSSVPLISSLPASEIGTQEAKDIPRSEMATTEISPWPEQLDELKEPDVEQKATAEPSRQRPGLSNKHQFSLQDQTSVQSISGTKVNPVTLNVFTMKDGEHCSMRFESGRLTTTQQIMSRMLESLGMPSENEQVFSLWLTSKHLQLQLKSYHLPCKLFKRWKDLLSQYTTANFEEVCKDLPILSFQRNVFFPLKEERKLLKKQDPTEEGNYRKAIDFLYHEAVFNTTKGRYPFSVDDLHTLAGLQGAIQCKEKGKTSADILPDISNYYPSHILPKKGFKIASLFKQKPVENSLQDQFNESIQEASKKCEDAHQLKVLYLQFCWHKPYYASAFFRGTVMKTFQPKHLLTTNEKQVVLAINTESVHLLSASLPSDILLYLTYDQLSWEFQAAQEEGEDFFSSLLLEFDSVLPAENKKVAKRIQIFSRQAPMMDAMISRCVECINQLEERLRQMRLQQGNKEFLDFTFPKNEGQTQTQELNYKEHKLQCTILDPEESQTNKKGSDFTLSRGLKGKKRKLGSGAAASSPTKGEEVEPLATTKDVTEMQDLQSKNVEPAPINSLQF